MSALSADIEAALAKAIGAFVRTQRADLLPPAVRRLRGFRPQALMQHRAELVGILQDDVQRRHIVEWLDNKPPLKAGEAQLLRIAAERSNGWESALAARSVEPRTRAAEPHFGAAVELEAALEHERAKSKRLRAELRRAREEDRKALEADRSRTSELVKQVRTLEKQLERAHSDAARQGAETTKALDELRRTERRTSRAAVKAAKEKETGEATLRRVKRDNRALKAKVAELESKVTEGRARRRQARPTPKRAAPAKRKPLPVPKGRFEDDPGTLDEWLGAAQVHLLVDGYNVTLAEGGFGSVALENQRERLRQETIKLVTKKKAHATIVFDGDLVAPGTAKLARGRVRVEYSRPEETADDHLIERLRSLPLDPVIVATNDRELQARAAELGATIATSTQLLALIR